jgi:hypothetical protein
MHREIDRAASSASSISLVNSPCRRPRERRSWMRSPEVRIVTISIASSPRHAPRRARARHARLRQRERAAACADAQIGLRHGTSQCYAGLYRIRARRSSRPPNPALDRRGPVHFGRPGRLGECSFSASRRPATRPRPRWCGARGRARRDPLQHRAVADRRASPYGGVVPEIAARAHVEALDRSSRAR